MREGGSWREEDRNSGRTGKCEQSQGGKQEKVREEHTEKGRMAGTRRDRKTETGQMLRDGE